MSESIFGFARPEDSPGFLLWQTTITWQRLIKQALIPYEISHAQFVILAILLWLTEAEQQSTQMAIINLSKLDKMTVSKSLRKLVTNMLVTRTEHKEDTRVKVVVLTAKGKKLTKKLVSIVEKIDAEFFSHLNNTKQETLITLLSQLSTSTKE